MKICDICKGNTPNTWAPAVARVTFELLPEGVPEGLDPQIIGLTKKFVGIDACYTCLTEGHIIGWFVKKDEPYPEPEKEEDI